MKGARIVLDQLQGREAAALLVDGQLQDFLIESAAPVPGTIYRAIADRPVKGQGGMFLKTPDGMGFLRQVKGLAPGQLLTVQVSGYAEPGKAIPLTQKLLFKSRYVILTPDAPGLNVSRAIKGEKERDRLLEVAHDVAGETGYGLIIRSSSESAARDAIAQDIEDLLALAGAVMQDQSAGAEVLVAGDGPHALAWREWVMSADVARSHGAFEANGVFEALDALLVPCVPLQAGAYFYVEPTRALVAVDVNTGPDISLAAGLKANIACAHALPRALRLRGLGGQIVIDPAPMPKKDRRGFEAALRQSFKADTIDTTLVGWTPLGHYELHRKRARLPLNLEPL